jgi:MtrB/PioB family decaheme-associated outer membrane protein
MKRTAISLLVAGLFVSTPDAYAQLKYSGSASWTVIGSDVNSQNPFRLEEYRDLSGGATAGMDLKGDSDTHRFTLFGENIGRDDQYIEFRGARYGDYKFSLYNNNIIHHLTYGAITPFSGAGNSNLTFPGALDGTFKPSLDTSIWTPFDYSIKHENYGGTYEWLRTAPYYIRVTGNQKETKGIRPLGSPGTSPGGPNYELPAVVDYTTLDASVEVGYATKTRQFSANISWSKFQDHNDFMNWRNPSIQNALSTTTTERTTLAADNDLWKLSLNALWKQLPLNSVLGLRGTYSQLTNNLPVSPTGTAVTGTTGQIVNTNSSSGTFNGEVINETMSASLTSQLARTLDSRLYWNWARKENNSTQIVFRPVNASTGASTQTCDLNPTTAAPLTTCTTELLHYTKNQFGVDLQWRMTPVQKLSGGWDYTDTKTERIDFDETKDNSVYVEYKNSAFDAATWKIKYRYLQRRSDFLLSDLQPIQTPALPTGQQSTLIFEKYLKRFDLNDNNQQLLKLAIDSSPQPFLDLGAEVILKKNDYQNVVLGRTEDTRGELYLSASYGDPKRFRVTVFADYEQTEYDSTHYQGTPNATTFPAAVNATTFLWTGKVTDKNYVLGLAADWPATERLKFTGALIWQETDGTVDFSANSAQAVLIPIPAYDSFHKTALNLKGTYLVDKNVEVTLGAAYERYTFNDAQMNGYEYTPVTGTNQNLLSGAYANPDYRALIGYCTLTYKF